MASLHTPDLDSSSAAADSVASSPRSENASHDGLLPRVRFMCSFGGKILPRPHDSQLRYVGGDTRIVAVNRCTTFSALLSKLSKLSGINNLTVKYQLPNEDLDALISVTTDEDVENMMEEYDRLSHNHNPRSARLRLFLFSNGDVGEDSPASSISSILNGSSNREQWFLDALNGGGPPHSASGGLERGRSEASSIVSEVPDYLFGLDNSDENPPRETKLKARPILHENVSVSDPGSPAPVISSPFCSTSSAPMPDLPPVRTKPDMPIPSPELKEAPNEGFLETGETIVRQPSGYPGNPMWQYAPSSHYPSPAVQPVPVYYVQGPVPPTTVPVQPIQIRAPYVPQYTATGAQVTQIPMGYHQPIPGSGQVYGGPVRQASTLDPNRPVPDGINQQVYYGVTNTGMMAATYHGMVLPHGAEDTQVTGMEAKMSRLSQ
ncbi:uncharacterized protein LOC116206648 [Punica granatum]|uniref:Uncharacterized protein LOC116206648 n=1 Tax=Punica granatum TaxID=22663 RepID=A0A6P8DPU9_PUNGR|nr:uncharacterized protein LOC116206648 [Punica granatum]